MTERRKVALVTGSAKGLGKATALALAEAGCDVALNYARSGREAKDLAERLLGLGVRAIAVKADITVGSDRRKLAETARDRLGTIDILVNNAGPFVQERKRFADYSQGEIDMLVQGNLVAAMELDALVLPAMREAGWGRLIHFGYAHAAEAPAWPLRAVYAAAKSGLVSFTKSLAVEEAEYGITVNMICPGDIRGAFKELPRAQALDVRDPHTPGGRPGTGEDIARVIRFLADPASDFLTGAVVDVSGGVDPTRVDVQHKKPSGA